MPGVVRAHTQTYEGMAVRDLRALMKERELSVAGIREKSEMVEFLREDDRKTPSMRARDRAARKKNVRDRERRPKRRSSDGCLHTPRQPSEVAQEYSSAPMPGASQVRHTVLEPLATRPEVLTSDDELSPLSTPTSGDRPGTVPPAPSAASVNWN